MLNYVTFKSNFGRKSDLLKDFLHRSYCNEMIRPSRACVGDCPPNHFALAELGAICGDG